MLDQAILALLVVVTLGLSYSLVFKVAAQAGKEYPARVRNPAIVAAVGVLACGIVQGLQLLGFMPLTSATYQIALSISLVTTVAAMWILAIRL